MVLGGTAATPHFGTRSLLYFLYSKHCDRPMSCDEERRPVAEFMRQFVAHVRCRRKKSSRSLSHLLMSFFYHLVVGYRPTGLHFRPADRSLS